jgi:hypothetical protein
MPRTPKLPRELRWRAFLGTDAIRRGLLTPDQLRGSSWRRLLRDAYADSGIPLDHDLLIDAASLLIPPGAVITGRSAAHFWGVKVAGPTDPVEVLTPPDQRFGPIRGIQVHTAQIPAEETFRAGDIPVTSPLRTAWEVARRQQPADAVAIIDALAAYRRISGTELLAYARTHRGEYGARKAEMAFELVEPLAESPQESRLRVYLILGGLPRPTVQFRVIHNGRFVARVDLAWPQQRLAIEYDGEWHSGRGQLARDRQRIRALSAAGWYVYPVTKYDMRSPDVLVKDIGRTLASRGWTDGERS